MEAEMETTSSGLGCRSWGLFTIWGLGLCLGV